MISVSYKKRDLYNIIAYLCKKISVFFCNFPMILCVTFFVHRGPQRAFTYLTLMQINVHLREWDVKSFDCEGLVNQLIHRIIDIPIFSRWNPNTNHDVD